MLAEERFQSILNILKSDGSVTVAKLTEILNTSESTIRRDLTELHKQGVLNKVHGGAVLKPHGFLSKDAEIALRQEMNKESKLKIAEYAAALIQEDDFVYLDAGSTTELMIEYLNGNGTVFVTNGIAHAKKLASKGYKVYILGGELKAATEAITGSDSVECLEKYNFTMGFFGTNGVGIDFGCTTPELSEAMVKKKAVSRCKLKYVVCDPSKFGQTSPITFASFEEVTIITSKIDIDFRIAVGSGNGAEASGSRYENIVEVDKG